MTLTSPMAFDIFRIDGSVLMKLSAMSLRPDPMGPNRSVAIIFGISWIGRRMTSIQVVKVSIELANSWVMMSITGPMMPSRLAAKVSMAGSWAMNLSPID